jgi:integrase
LVGCWAHQHGVGHDLRPDPLQGTSRQAAERSRRREDPQVEAVEDQLYEIKGLFRWAFDNRKFPIGYPNPGEGVRYKGKTDPRDKYQEFEPDEIALILTEARKAEPFVRWFRWLAAYCGARTAEIAEAQTSDIEVLADGTAVFHIRLLNRPVAQRLKTDFSPRPVPIHEAVKAEGFLSYVDWVKRTYHGGGEGPLLPMLKMYGGRLNDDASNRSMAWLRSIGIGVKADGGYDRRKCNHSWRHTCKTRFRDFMEEQFSDKLTGHVRGGEGREYGRFPIPLLRKQIEAVEPWEI